MELSPQLSLRQWQADALSAWLQNQRGIVQVVTGGGKTIFALFCIREFFEKNPEGHVVILVPTIALLDQWYLEVMEHTSFQAEDIGLFGGGNSGGNGHRISLMVLNTARSAARRIAAEKSILLVVDECHRSGTEENVKAIDIEPKSTLGLSATPEREFDDGFEDLIEPNLGPVIFQYSFREALRDQVICPFQLINVFVEADAQIAAKLGQCNTPEGQITDAADYRRIVNAMKVMAAVSVVKKHVLENVIIFNERISLLEGICRALRTHKLSALEYHSRLGDRTRRFNLQLFRSGQTKRLVTCRALDEGLNVPQVSVGIIAFSTRSTRQRIQRLGRVLRPAPGKEAASVYTFYCSDSERERLEQESSDLDGLASVKWGSLRIDG